MKEEIDKYLDEQVSEIEKDLIPYSNSIAVQVESCKIQTEHDLQSATDLAKFIGEILRKLEEERKQLVDPFNQAAKSINQKFKEITVPFAVGRDAVKKAIGDFMQHKAQQKQLEAEAVRKELSFDGIGSEAPTAIAEVARGNYGTASMVDKWEFELLNITEVPERFTMRVLDVNAVREAIDGGVRDIPGIKISNRPTVRVR